jgi:cobalt-zinc-cadmium efflux system outer membrane protein
VGPVHDAGVLAAQDRLGLAQQQLELSRQAHAAVVQRINAGKDSPVDEPRASVVVSKSQMQRRRAEAALATARQQLAATWGAQTATFEQVVGDLYQVSPPPRFERAAAMLAENPDLARWATEERTRRAALRLEKARASPDVTVLGGLQRFEENDDTALVLGLAVPVPLFDRNQGGIERATANLAGARQKAEAARLKVRTALSSSLHALAAAYIEVNILQDEVLPKAKQAFEAAQRGYGEGKFDYLYVLDAQRTLFETRAQLIDLAQAYQQTRADVERLTGRDLDVAAQHGPAGPANLQSAQEDSHEE